MLSKNPSFFHVLCYIKIFKMSHYFSLYTPVKGYLNPVWSVVKKLKVKNHRCFNRILSSRIPIIAMFCCGVFCCVLLFKTGFLTLSLKQNSGYLIMFVFYVSAFFIKCHISFRIDYVCSSFKYKLKLFSLISTRLLYFANKCLFFSQI